MSDGSCLCNPEPLRPDGFGCVVPAGAWHTVEVMEPSVIMEVKAGRYGEDDSESR